MIEKYEPYDPLIVGDAAVALGILGGKLTNHNRVLLVRLLILVGLSLSMSGNEETDKDQGLVRFHEFCQEAEDRFANLMLTHPGFMTAGKRSNV